MIKVNLENLKASGWKAETIPAMQIAVYVMCGGGHLGRFAAEEPKDFYIDDRVAGLPYKREEIIQAVAVLAAIARINGITELPEMPRFHNMGIF